MHLVAVTGVAVDRAPLHGAIFQRWILLLCKGSKFAIINQNCKYRVTKSQLMEIASEVWRYAVGIDDRL